MDKIIIKGLKVLTRIGCESTERESTQEIELDIELEVDNKKAAESESLSDTVCYLTLKNHLAEFIEGSEWSLVEKLAEDVSGFIFESSPLIEGVDLLVKKFVVRGTEWVGVRVSRGRQQ